MRETQFPAAKDRADPGNDVFLAANLEAEESGKLAHVAEPLFRSRVWMAPLMGVQSTLYRKTFQIRGFLRSFGALSTRKFSEISKSREFLPVRMR